MELLDYQLDALYNMKNGCILCGGVGSGKSLTSLSYYYMKENGDINFLKGGKYIEMKKPKDLYIITTARKRDLLEWDKELSVFLLSRYEDLNYYDNKIVVDSWNNITKYKDVKDAFFIFDEQRAIGYGTWGRTFIHIAKNNNWIMLSATPGDVWKDYIPVFIANGFYKNKTHFEREHVIYSRHAKYPKIDRYINTEKLEKIRNYILVDMDFKRDTIAHHEDIYVKYDISKYKDAGRLRWDPYKNEPIKNASSLCYIWRRIVNEDESRQMALLEIFEDHPKMIIFYNFNYELDILRKLFSDISGVQLAEWNGQKHEELPEGDSWVYLVQYNSGSEGWNCITTDTMVFYSENHSYKMMTQASGRIDRLNTPFKDLYYYHLKTRSGIDRAISNSLKNKRDFNERRFIKW